jgi:hypothetical protein
MWQNDTKALISPTFNRDPAKAYACPVPDEKSQVAVINYQLP